MPNNAPLSGLRVIDAATLFAGPMAGMLLGDFGADVIKLEHPNGDTIRHHGITKNGIPLWWKTIGRNKRPITLDLGEPDGQEVFKQLVRTADVVIENFRPGTFERWGLGYDVLSAINPRLILVRVTGFGQFGPYSKRPGFGTLAEAMSGFASITGEPDGPPTLPSFGLADGITGISAAYATMVALHSRNQTGLGQVVDLALIEPILTVLGAQPIMYDQLKIVRKRTGNRSAQNAPRNTYKTADGRWLAISTSSRSIAERLMTLVGRPEVTKEPWFATAKGRHEHVEELDSSVAAWIAARPAGEVMKAMEEAQAAVAPIYDIADVFADPQYQALDSITTVEDDELGPLRMQNVIFRLSQTPGSIRMAGQPLGAANEAIYKGELGLSDERLAELQAKKVI